MIFNGTFTRKFHMLAILFFIVLLAAGISLILWSLKNGISPMPTSPKVKAGLLSLLPAELEGKIYELGSGWGTLVFSLAKKYPDCQVIGFETSPIPFWFSRFWARCFGSRNVLLLKQDFFSVNLSDGALLICYLYPGAMKKLKEKFEVELPPGCLVISHTFAVPGWINDKVLEINDLYHTKIYFYKVIRSSRLDKLL